MAELDASTGTATIRFVNTGSIFGLNEWKSAGRNYLLVGGFNNEYDGGMLAVIDEGKPFASSPQTKGTRHECLSCAAGEPERYFAFPRSEINQVEQVYKSPVSTIRLADGETEISVAELHKPGGVRTIYRFDPEKGFALVSLRYDSDYDALHKELSAQGRLKHTLEECPERAHPKPVRMWTPANGWSELPLKPAKANQ